ncbi:MAG: deoxyribose-phosphate aldolase [Anaerolineales bacterium]|nr:deoxyribose-phosphate aldolase [Anaerolineales bacterium]
MNIHTIATMIDNTEISPLKTSSEMRIFIESSAESGFGGVCLTPRWISMASEILQGSDTSVSMVVGLHVETIAMQVHAIEEGTAAGANVFDILMPLHAVKAGEWQEVQDGVGAVVSAADDLPIRMILETDCLTDEEIRHSCQICMEAKVAFVKTSTGLNGPGARVEAVRLMYATVAGSVGVKASGGIRTYDQLLSMVDAGASRIGTRTAWSILEEAQQRLA